MAGRYAVKAWCWRAAQSQNVNRDQQQLKLSHTSKGVDRIHKSTVAMKSRAEHRSISQTATPKVMREQDLEAHNQPER